MPAQEVVKNYHRVVEVCYYIKVDIMKAYDLVDWNLILHYLLCVGALEKFVHWVRQCITSPNFSIVLNGTFILVVLQSN